MRVKYNNHTFHYSSSVAGGTSSFWANVLQEIAEYLAEAGAPLDLKNIYIDKDSTSTTSYGGALVEIPFKNDQYGGLILNVTHHKYNYSSTSTNTTIYAVLEVGGHCGDSYFWSDDIRLGESTYRNFEIEIHAKKSGNSFFFGISDSGTSSNAAIMNYAITPMKRMSNPTESLGYAVIEGPRRLYYEYTDRDFYTYRTLPDLNDYYHNERARMPDIDLFPNINTKKIPVLPLCSGVEDIYYENVYITTMKNDGVEEKAFETDEGIFIISSGLWTDGDGEVDWSNYPCCQLAFDITEAVNSGN